MRCIDLYRQHGAASLLATLVLCVFGAGCGDREAAGPAAPAASSATAASATAASTLSGLASAAAAATQASVAAAAAPSAPGGARATTDTSHTNGRVQLPPPPTPADADDLRLLFARRLVAAHPDTSYMTPAPDRLLAIPVLEVELNADGSVRRIVVLRKPTTGGAATALAIAAVRRAAPYGDVSKLPKPWKVVETFLFDDQLHFKPRTLDL